MVKLTEKIGYALGDAAAGGITWKIMSIAFPFYFTNVFGLSLGDTAMLMLLARLFDVVTDPLMGSIADRTKSRWGTYRPWLIFGAIPYGLIFAGLLYTPDFDPVSKRVYAYALYLMMMAVYTMVNVPYGSMLGVMTDDANERNQFSAYRMVGAYAMGFLVLFAFPYIQNMIGGDEYVSLNEQLKALKESNAEASAIQVLEQQIVPFNRHIYASVGVIFGILAAVLTCICGLFTKERVQPKRAEKFSFKQYGELLTNKPWVYITLTALCTNFFNGFRYAVASYIFTYCLGGDITISSLIINFTVFMGIGEAVCMIFGGVSPWFTKKVGSKRMAFVWAAVICCVSSIAFFFIPMEAGYIWVLIAITVITSIGCGLYSPLLWSMYADVADYATQKNGSSSTGLIFSSGTMAQKLGGAISGALITLFLGWSGVTMIADELGNESIDPASVTDSVCTMIWSLFSLFPAGIALVMAILAYKFPIKK